MLTELFQLTRIINLERRVDRRIETMRELSRHNMASESVVFFMAHEPADTQGFETVGAAGCFLSHLSILRKAQEMNTDVLILEDDVSFSSRVARVDKKLLCSENWDILFFGYNGPKVDFDKDLSLVPVTEDMQQTHCYAVSVKSVRKLIPFLEAMLKRAPGDPLGGPMHYDGALNTFRVQTGAKVFRTSANLASQRASETDIHEKSRWDTAPVLRPITKAYRRARFALSQI